MFIRAAFAAHPTQIPLYRNTRCPRIPSSGRAASALAIPRRQRTHFLAISLLHHFDAAEVEFLRSRGVGYNLIQDGKKPDSRASTSNAITPVRWFMTTLWTSPSRSIASAAHRSRWRFRPRADGRRWRAWEGYHRLYRSPNACAPSALPERPACGSWILSLFLIFTLASCSRETHQNLPVRCWLRPEDSALLIYLMRDAGPGSSATIAMMKLYVTIQEFPRRIENRLKRCSAAARMSSADLLRSHDPDGRAERTGRARVSFRFCAIPDYAAVAVALASFEDSKICKGKTVGVSSAGSSTHIRS